MKIVKNRTWPSLDEIPDEESVSHSTASDDPRWSRGCTNNELFNSDDWSAPSMIEENTSREVPLLFQRAARVSDDRDVSCDTWDVPEIVDKEHRLYLTYYLISNYQLERAEKLIADHWQTELWMVCACSSGSRNISSNRVWF
eukprot:GHVL01006790.1.p1 GENE.GHVL01006790.1~~GHVL01006790.1.p1  ORF type:complete len:142 (-),score=20.35 GHVL01006790.1:117-542(-)